MAEELLKRLGLNENEIKVYLTCLRLGNVAVSVIAKKNNINRTTVYAIVENLTKKGYLASFIRSGINYYSAIEPELLIEKSKQALREAEKTLKFAEMYLPILKKLEPEKSDLKAHLTSHFPIPKPKKPFFNSNPSDINNKQN
jgi:sugar-specific transcriptional regulator TrmB